MIIQLSRDDTAQGLAKLREIERAMDGVRVAENDMRRFVAHLASLYHVPPGFVIQDWAKGFEEAEEAGDNGNDDGPRTERSSD